MAPCMNLGDGGYTRIETDILADTKAYVSSNYILRRPEHAPLRGHSYWVNLVIRFLHPFLHKTGGTFEPQHNHHV